MLTVMQGEFNIDDIQDTVWNDSPWDNLVLPDNEKNIIMAFADRPRLSGLGFDDFVEQKG